MPVLDLTDLPAATAPYTPLVGLDLGEKTIGVAVSDHPYGPFKPLDGFLEFAHPCEDQTGILHDDAVGKSL